MADQILEGQTVLLVAGIATLRLRATSPNVT